jgi:hypothetical protein
MSVLSTVWRGMGNSRPEDWRKVEIKEDVPSQLRHYERVAVEKIVLTKTQRSRTVNSVAPVAQVDRATDS